MPRHCRTGTCHRRRRGVAVWSDTGHHEQDTTTIELTAASTGVWWVHTASGAVHIWDFDTMTVTRARPCEHTGMRWDGDPVSIVTVVEYPRVGSGFGVVLDTPGVEGMVTIRTSSDVVSIERAPS